MKSYIFRSRGFKVEHLSVLKRVVQRQVWVVQHGAIAAARKQLAVMSLTHTQRFIQIRLANRTEKLYEERKKMHQRRT